MNIDTITRSAITLDLEEGREDSARADFGDAQVDQVIADDLGITVEQLRTPGALDGINEIEGP